MSNSPEQPLTQLEQKFQAVQQDISQMKEELTKRLDKMLLVIQGDDTLGIEGMVEKYVNLKSRIKELEAQVQSAIEERNRMLQDQNQKLTDALNAQTKASEARMGRMENRLYWLSGAAAVGTALLMNIVNHFWK